MAVSVEQFKDTSGINASQTRFTRRWQSNFEISGQNVENQWRVKEMVAEVQK